MKAKTEKVPRNSNRLDIIIKKLVQSEKLPYNTTVKIPLTDIQLIYEQSLKVIKEEPILLSLEAPVIVCGDLYGRFYDLLAYFRECGLPPDTKYLFLGNYIDDGANSIETISLLLALKARYPNNIWLLRGSHESLIINRNFNFFIDCAKNYNQKVYENFNLVFQYLPLAAIISGKIFCVHGGLSSQLTDLSQIKKIPRPLIDIPTEGMIHDLIWSNPSSQHLGFEPPLDSESKSFTFGEDVANKFLNKNGFEAIFRGNQVICTGFEFPFSDKTPLLTIFSASDFNNTANKGALVDVEEDLRCSFYIINPPKKELPRTIFSPPASLSKKKNNV